MTESIGGDVPCGRTSPSSSCVSRWPLHHFCHPHDNEDDKDNRSWIDRHVESFLLRHCTPNLISPLVTTTCKITVVNPNTSYEKISSLQKRSVQENLSSEDQQDGLRWDDSNSSASVQTFQLENKTMTEKKNERDKKRYNSLPNGSSRLKDDKVEATQSTQLTDLRKGERNFKNFILFDNKSNTRVAKEGGKPRHSHVLKGKSKASFGERFTKISFNKLKVSLDSSSQIFRLTELIQHPDDEMKIQAVELEKAKVKSELKTYDQIFYCFYGKYPTHEEKEPLRPLYAYYRRIKQALEHIQAVYAENKHSNYQKVYITGKKQDKRQCAAYLVPTAVHERHVDVVHSPKGTSEETNSDSSAHQLHVVVHQDEHRSPSARQNKIRNKSSWFKSLESPHLFSTRGEISQNKHRRRYSTTSSSFSSSHPF